MSGFAMVVPLQDAGGGLVGSLSLYADSATALRSTGDQAFGDVVAQLGRAVGSVRTIAVAELTSILIRGGR